MSAINTHNGSESNIQNPPNATQPASTLTNLVVAAILGAACLGAVSLMTDKTSSQQLSYLADKTVVVLGSASGTLLTAANRASSLAMLYIVNPGKEFAKETFKVVVNYDYSAAANLIKNKAYSSLEYAYNNLPQLAIFSKSN